MCTVVLIADVLRLADGHRGLRSPGSPPRSICRRLFAEERGAETAGECVRRLEADLEREVRQRWNFDFRTETPLPGRYQWTPVGAAKRAPATTTTDGPRSSAVRDRQPKGPATATQAKITDFLHQRKRPRTTDSDSALCPKVLKARRISPQPTAAPSVVTID